MPIQILAVVLGIAGLVLRALTNSSALGLIVPALALFILIDLLGLLTGQLKLTLFTFAPIAPALLVHPWYMGLLWGFVVIASVDVLISIVFGAVLLRRRT